MEPTSGATSEGLPLAVKKGVAAFDPVTLLLAAKKGTSKNIQVRLHPELDLPIPRALKGMAKVSFGIDPVGRLLISTVIDTGKMKWNLDDADAEHSYLEDYKAVGRRGVELGYLPVLNSDKSVVTCAPMKTPKGKPVTCWFTELPQELDEFDGYDLLALAQVATRDDIRAITPRHLRDRPRSEPSIPSARGWRAGQFRPWWRQRARDLF